jgi:hypothetical protein
VGEERRKQAEKWARVQGTTAFAGFDPATLKANRPIAASG